MNKKKKPITLYIDQSLLKILNAEIKRLGINRPTFFDTILKKYFENDDMKKIEKYQQKIINSQNLMDEKVTILIDLNFKLLQTIVKNLNIKDPDKFAIEFSNTLIRNIQENKTYFNILEKIARGKEVNNE